MKYEYETFHIRAFTVNTLVICFAYWTNSINPPMVGLNRIFSNLNKVCKLVNQPCGDAGVQVILHVCG